MYIGKRAHGLRPVQAKFIRLRAECLEVFNTNNYLNLKFTYPHP